MNSLVGYIGDYERMGKIDALVTRERKREREMSMNYQEERDV